MRLIVLPAVMLCRALCGWVRAPIVDEAREQPKLAGEEEQRLRKRSAE